MIKARNLVATTILVTMASLAVAISANGQGTDSIQILLNSASISDRSEGLSRLLTLTPAQWPAGTQSEVVNLLTREGESMLGVEPAPEGAGELAGTYHINLVKAALQLNDPSTLRGMITLGMKVSGRAKRFVAAQGATAFPELTRAYTADDLLKVPVVQVVGMILASNSGLTDEQRRTGIGILLGASGYELAYLPNPGQFPELYGAVAWAADSDDASVERQVAARALPGFVANLGEFTASELWRRELAVLGLACADAARAHCESLPNVGSTVQAHIDSQRWGPARNALNAFIQQLSQSCARAQMTPAACRILKLNAQRVLTKLS